MSKVIIGNIFIVLFGILIGSIFVYNLCVSNEYKRCSDFKTQKEAQANYRSYLDRDHDGVACESLP